MNMFLFIVTQLNDFVVQDTKVAINHDVLPDGTIVKAGDHVAFVPYSMGRMKFLWGDDALEFKPERWLHDGLFRAVSPFKFTAFQVVQQVAMLQNIICIILMFTHTLLTSRFFLRCSFNAPSKTIDLLLTGWTKDMPWERLGILTNEDGNGINFVFL